VTSPPPPVVTPPPPPVVETPPPPPVVVTPPPPPVVESPPPPVVVTPPPPPVVETPPPVVVVTPPLVETLLPPPLAETPPVPEPQQIEIEQVMESSVDIANQVDALSDESGTNDSEPEEEAGITSLIEDSVTNNAFVQVIQPEDIGNAADPDDAPVLSANCVCQ
ncbi:MAG: hypothetical protein ABL951_07480, partial [Alphaproteobacteria bacterium]